MFHGDTSINQCKFKQTKKRKEKNVHERRSKKKKKNGTKRLNGKKGKTHSLGRNQVEYQRNTFALMNCYVIQLSHEGEVNTLRGIVVLVLPNQLDKNEENNFCKLKTSLGRNFFVYNLQTFRRFCQVIFTTFVANSA